MAGKRNIPKSWFGYRVRDTDAYLRKLESMHRFEADEIEARLKEQQSRYEQLKAKVEEMRRQPDATPLPAERAELLLQRLDRSVEAIERQGQAEADSLRRLLDRHSERHARRMSDWDKQLEDYRQALEFLLEEAAVLIGKVKDKPSAGSEERLVSEAEETMRAAAASAAAVPPGSLAEETEEDEWKPEPKASEVASTAKILQFKLRSILNESPPQVEDVRAPKSSMTADGLSMEDAQTAEMPAKPKSADRDLKKPTASSAFWGDLALYLDDADQVPALPAPMEETIEGTTVPELSIGEEKVTEEEKAALLGTPAPAEQAAAREIPPSSESPGLSDEIVSIQNRYIVGKAAGENLYGTDGRLIIAKGQTITAEIVQAAEREGKLPDLIVHMVIPGFHADES